jgi:hypothetical protein
MEAVFSSETVGELLSDNTASHLRKATAETATNQLTRTKVLRNQCVISRQTTSLSCRLYCNMNRTEGHATDSFFIFKLLEYNYENFPKPHMSLHHDCSCTAYNATANTRHGRHYTSLIRPVRYAGPYIRYAIA